MLGCTTSAGGEETARRFATSDIARITPAVGSLLQKCPSTSATMHRTFAECADCCRLRALRDRRKRAFCTDLGLMWQSSGTSRRLSVPSVSASAAIGTFRSLIVFFPKLADFDYRPPFLPLIRSTCDQRFNGGCRLVRCKQQTLYCDKHRHRHRNCANA